MSVRRKYLNLKQPFSDREPSLTVASYEEISQNTEDNFVFSPFAAETITAFIYLGAHGDTADQIRKALAYKPQTQNIVQLCFTTVLNAVRTQIPTFTMGNNVFVSNSHDLKSYIRHLAFFFFMGLDSIKFSNPVEAINAMNLKIKNNTGEHAIQDLITNEYVKETSKIILSSFTKFRGFWRNEFHEEMNLNIRFYETRNKDGYYPGLMRKWYYHYYEHPHLDCKFVEVYFLGSDISLTIALPNDIEGLAALESKIELVVRVDHPLSKRLMTLHLPKFKIENKIDYKKILRRLGVEKAFLDNESDFSCISNNSSELCIDEIIQKSVVDFGQTGCNTSGVTSPFDRTHFREYDKFSPWEKGTEMTVDHPFIFYIRAKDLVLTVGRVVKLVDENHLTESDVEVD